MARKPKWKKPAFWLTTIPVVLGAVLASGILDETVTVWDNKLVGLGIGIFAALGYGASRATKAVKERRARKDRL